MKIDFSYADKTLQEMMESDYVKKKGESINVIWVDDDTGKCMNIIAEFPENKWGLGSFSFADVSKIGGGLNIMCVFKDEDSPNKTMSYHQAFGNLSELLIVQNNIFKNFLTHMKVNKEHLNVEHITGGCFFTDEEN